jgi:hypothetical protein
MKHAQKHRKHKHFVSGIFKFFEEISGYIFTPGDKGESLKEKEEDLAFYVLKVMLNCKIKLSYIVYSFKLSWF